MSLVIMSLNCYVPAIGIILSIPLTEKIYIKKEEYDIKSLTIDIFKKYIYERKNNILKDLTNDASDLDLWHVNVDYADGVYTEEYIVQKLGGEKMMPHFLFNNCFSQPLEARKIHIIITGECPNFLPLEQRKFRFLYNVLTIFIPAYALY